jgi:hypothetical protein
VEGARPTSRQVTDVGRDSAVQPEPSKRAPDDSSWHVGELESYRVSRIAMYMNRHIYHLRFLNDIWGVAIR